MNLQRSGDTQSGTPLTIAPPAGGGGGGSQNLFETVAGDTGSAVADSTTDTLTIAGGTGLTTTGQSTPDKITVDLDTPVAVANGGTNATTFALTNGIALYDGSKLATGTITHPSANKLDEIGTVQSHSSSFNIHNSTGDTMGSVLGAGTVANYLQLRGSATTADLVLAAVGTDANINIDVQPKGTGTLKANGTEVVGTTSTQTLTNKTLTAPVFDTTAVFDAEYDNGTKTANFTVDWTNGNTQTVTINVATVTISFTDPPGAGHFTLRLVMGATPPTTITWPSGVKWPRGGTAPVPSANTNDVDIFTFYFSDTGAGTNYYGTHVPDMA